ncbi:MAG: hypothetical protein JNL39_03610 [Opitutaceae bacterium]|nr:hypothetical protein [Opitutaceae bacterium]
MLVRTAIDETVTQGVYLPDHTSNEVGGELRNVDWWPLVAKGPGVISVSTAKISAGAIGVEVFGLPHRSRVVLYPVYDDLECEVTIPGYAEWLPQGNIANPKAPGNTLVARAVLKSKSGKTKELPEVERFRFELLDTSREPGICLNWPLGASDSEYDLKFTDIGAGGGTPDQLAALRKFFSDWGMTSSGDFDRASMPAGGLPPLSFGTVSDDGQKAELLSPGRNQAGQPFADAAVDCHDFGAKAELRVVCVLKDGREIIGLMKGDGGEQDLVRLPKRAGPDWIAEKWRMANDATKLAANDDDEKVAGQRHHGDGFALYEEYRGWVVNGKHVTGDPKRKDFFVLNQRGADFRGGIALFARLSQLRVHSGLRDGIEMSDAERRMNRNHRDAPHLVDQHGVILAKENGFSGGTTVGVDGVDKNRAFRPRYVARIFMSGSEAGRGVGLLSAATGMREFELSARDAELAWDRAVAHELLHSVGVDHHGEALREKVCCYFQGATAPLNTSGKHRFVSRYSLSPGFYTRDGSHPFGEDWSDDRGPEITLQWEDTRRDVFEEQIGEYQQRLQLYRGAAGTETDQKYLAELAGKLAYTGKSAEWWGRYSDEEGAAYPVTRVIWVGAKNGTDSGHDLCVMKYYFADAYRMAGKENAYYLIRPGAVQAGREICRSPKGTDANASGHQPHPRFGDAAGGRGDCFGQICPNDAIPPRNVALR